jgi:hypothetical protein
MMTKKHTFIRSILFAYLIVLLVFATGCTTQTIIVTPSPLPTNTPLPPTTVPHTPTNIPHTPTTIPHTIMPAVEVKTLSAEFDRIAKAHAEAWDKGDLEPMRQWYTSDILYYEGIDTIEGIDNVISLMMDGPIRMHPNLEVRLVDTFIGRGTGFDAWDMRGWIDIPVTEYNLYTLRDGKIADWRYSMGAAAMAADGAPMSEKLLQDYATAWSSGDPEAVANLYAPESVANLSNPDVVRQDTLFGYDVQGRSAIKDFAANFFAWYPGVRLELQYALQFSVTEPGGVYAIHVSDQTGEPCDVRAIILLRSYHDKIINERLFYNADSLIACGWAQ